MIRWLAMMTFLAAATVTFPALAQTSGSAQAEELFKQGRAALEQHDYVTACLRLSESNRIERAVGTLISLAECEEARQLFASAHQHWREAADFADAIQDRLDRAPYARKRAADIEPRVPRVTLRSPNNAPPSLAVKLDDVTLERGSLDTALPMDPGKHTLITSAEGHEPTTLTIELAPGGRQVVDLALGAPVKPPPKDEIAGPSPSTPTEPRSLRPYAYVLGGVGVAGIVTGSVLGLVAASTWADAKDECRPGACGPGSQALNDRDSAAAAGNGATAAFIIGGVALAAALVVFMIEPRHAPRLGHIGGAF